MKKKTLTIAIALVLVVALAVGATYAYLTAKTEAVKNTFVAGGAVKQSDLELFEHVANKKTDGSYTLNTNAKATAGENGVYNSYTVMPGVNLPKDPTVNVKAASGAYYLFVEVTKGSGFAPVKVGDKTGTPLSCNVDATKWEKLSLTGKDAEREVYVYYVTGENAAKTYIQSAPVSNVAVLETIGDTQNTIVVNADNDIVAALTSASASALTFNAYACQAAGFDTAAAAFTACFGTK